MLLPFVANTSAPPRRPSANLTLGPVSLSLPELAQALTQAGMATEAVTELADRGAFVCLKDRTPEKVRAVLGEALGVAFEPKGAGWRMVVDPAAKAREAGFLALYRRQAVEKAREYAVVQDALRAGRAYAAVDADVRSAAKGFERLPDPPDAATKARLRRLFSESVLLNPSVWAGVGLFRDPAAVSDAIGGPVTRSAPAGSLGLPAAALGEAPAQRVTLGLAFDPATGTMAGQGWTTTTDGATASLPPYPFEAQIGPYPVSGTGGGAETRVEGVTLVETFNRMGQAAGDYLRSFDPLPELPTTPTTPGPMPATLSSLLERLGVEAVMELSPRFEALPRREVPPSLSLAEGLAIPPYPAPPPGGAPAWLVALSERQDWGSVVARARAFPWRVRSRDGIFELIDPVAFLDHAQWVSPVPTLRVGRILADVAPGAPTDRSGTPLPDWSRLERIAGALDGSGGLVADYRGLRLDPFAALLPIVRLVAAIPASEQAALWRDAQRPEGATVAVAGGTLSLAASRWGAEYGYARPVARVIGRWTGPKGEVRYGEGTIDPHGTVGEG